MKTMKIESQVAAVTAHYSREIDRRKSALAVARRALSALNGRTVRVIEVDRSTGTVTERVRSSAHPNEIARAESTVTRYESEIAALAERRDLSIMSIEIAAEDNAKREGARRARDAFAISCIEDGIDTFTAEVG